MSNDPNSAASVRAWDIPTRAFHWALVFCIISAWVSFEYADKLGDDSLRWHRWNGLGVVVLLVFRVLWGLFGASTARFANFLRWPWSAAAYGLDLLRGRDRHFLGHNPLGSYMILALLAVVGAQAVLGLYSYEPDDYQTAFGPLSNLISEGAAKSVTAWHKWAFKRVLLPLIGLHIIANVLYGMLKKDPLIRAMVTGRKPRADYEDGAEAGIEPESGRRAALCLVAAIALVFGAIALAGGKLV